MDSVTTRLPDTWRTRIQAYQPRLVPPGQRQAAVMLLLAPGERGQELLLTRRALHLSSHAGEVSLPGGNREVIDQSLYHTALRETREEAGLRDEPERLGQLDSLYAKSGIEVSAFVSAMDQKPALKACPDEVADLFWLPLDDLMDNPPEYKWFERHGRQWQVPFFYYDQWTIWGMTGMILVNLINVLNESQWPSFHDEWAENPMDSD